MATTPLKSVELHSHKWSEIMVPKVMDHVYILQVWAMRPPHFILLSLVSILYKYALSFKYEGGDRDIASTFHLQKRQEPEPTDAWPQKMERSDCRSAQSNNPTVATENPMDSQDWEVQTYKKGVCIRNIQLNLHICFCDNG